MVDFYYSGPKKPQKESLLPSGQECEIYTELRFYLITNLYAQDEVIHSILDFKAEFPISILVDFDWALRVFKNINIRY